MNVMSKKGKKGEAILAITLAKITQVEENFEFKKPTYTNAPDDGLDFAVKMPHNFHEKLDAIIQNKDEIPSTSSTEVEVRIDNKDYAGKISKPIVDKFINDCEKHPDMAEHWMTGGKGLTKGAEKALNGSDYVTRYYSKEDLNTIDNYYQQELDNEVDVEIYDE